MTTTLPQFDHEKLDVYQLSIEYVADSYQIAKSLSGMNRHVRDQWLRASQSVPLNIAEGNGKRSSKDKSRFFEIARASAWSVLRFTTFSLYAAPSKTN